MEFKDLNKEDRLIEVAHSYKKNDEQWIEALKKDGDPRIGSMVLWGVNQSYALKSYFIDKDIEQGKQHFYTCGRLDEFLITKYDEKILDYGINHLSYALLSDNEALIKRYANLRHSNYEAMIKGGGTAPMYILQCIIKDDWKEYERVMPIMKTKTVKKFKMEMDAAYYEALAERSKSKLEEILSEFVTPKIHKQRNKAHELINEFISHPAIGYAKLAWLKGIEVKIDSPLVPSDLLPVKPNETYQDDYDFLKA
ncbi:MAG: Imm49 family immunity protein [Cyclobacteriaceae bacterium]|jgi:hypothetical protein